MKTEAVYGEGFLRFAYERPAGRVALEGLVKRVFFSRIYGAWANSPVSRPEVERFVRRFGVDASEFAVDPGRFPNFNAFFFRRLKEGARPIAPEPDAVVFPADGRHLGLPDLGKVEGLWAKGQRLDLETFLGDAALAARYREGTAVISRLCPVDYHRFHFCLAGTPAEAEKIRGPLYSVNPIALRRSLRYFVSNKRFITRLQTADAGLVTIVEIGATNVGSVVQTYRPGQETEKGQEKGYFAFGGSAVALFFERGAVTLSEDLNEHGQRGREVYAKMGDVLGVAG